MEDKKFHYIISSSKNCEKNEDLYNKIYDEVKSDTPADKEVDFNVVDLTYMILARTEDSFNSDWAKICYEKACEDYISHNIFKKDGVILDYFQLYDIIKDDSTKKEIESEIEHLLAEIDRDTSGDVDSFVIEMIIESISTVLVNIEESHELEVRGR